MLHGKTLGKSLIEKKICPRLDKILAKGLTLKPTRRRGEIPRRKFDFEGI